jgi:hypothetical protein
MLLALIVVIGLVQGVFKLHQTIMVAAEAIATFLVAIALTYIVTKFDLIACFIAAVHGHHEQQGNGGFDDPKRYVLRSTGNLLAYLLSTVPLCVLATRALGKGDDISHDKLPRTLFIALAATLFIAAFSGLFYLETERIWIFLTPALALAAGFEAARQADRSGPRFVLAMVLLVLVISCSQEFLFMHYR